MVISSSLFTSLYDFTKPKAPAPAPIITIRSFGFLYFETFTAQNLKSFSF